MEATIRNVPVLRRVLRSQLFSDSGIKAWRLQYATYQCYDECYDLNYIQNRARYRTLTFSFCWTKSVVSRASDAVTVLHIGYLLTWLAISMSRFTRSFSYPLLRCYAVTHCLPETWLSICRSCFTRLLSYRLLRSYAVTMFV